MPLGHSDQWEWEFELGDFEVSLVTESQSLEVMVWMKYH